MKILLSLILLGGVFFGVFTAFQTITPHSYSGTLLMEEAEYQDFKHLLAEDWVKVSTLQALSSEEHLVNFKVSVPNSKEFPYGTYPKAVNLAFNLVMSGVITLFLGAVIFWMIPQMRDEEKA